MSTARTPPTPPTHPHNQNPTAPPRGGLPPGGQGWWPRARQGPEPWRGFAKPQTLLARGTWHMAHGAWGLGLNAAQKPFVPWRHPFFSPMTSDNLLADWGESALTLENALNAVMVGMPKPVRSVVVALFARGHVLLEGDVGVGKTTLLQALARGIGGGYQRIEGTID